MAFKFLILALSISTAILLSPSVAQITAPCTSSMISTFSPCMNFVTNSNLNGTTPPAACCSSLNSLMTNGKECLCLIATGSVPFRIPINRTLAISLPRSCNMPGVPLQCKSAGAPAPAPALALAPEPSYSPDASPSPDVEAPPEPLSPGPPAATTNGGATTSNTGSRTGLTPSSSAQPSYGISHFHLVMTLIGAIALKCY